MYTLKPIDSRHAYLHQHTHTHTHARTCIYTCIDVYVTYMWMQHVYIYPSAEEFGVPPCIQLSGSGKAVRHYAFWSLADPEDED